MVRLLNLATNSLCLLLTKAAVLSFYLPLLFDTATIGLVYVAVGLSMACSPCPVIASALALSSPGGAPAGTASGTHLYWILGWLFPAAGAVLVNLLFVLLPIRVLCPLTLVAARKTKTTLVLMAAGL